MNAAFQPRTSCAPRVIDMTVSTRPGLGRDALPAVADIQASFENTPLACGATGTDNRRPWLLAAVNFNRNATVTWAEGGVFPYVLHSLSLPPSLFFFFFCLHTLVPLFLLLSCLPPFLLLLLLFPGRSCLFPFEDGFLDDGHGDPSLTPGLNSPTRCQNGERMERYSRKVFVGGLPPDIDEDEITNSFRRYGHLVVDWPHKAESKSYFPPKGYAFLLFQEETSVQALIDACIEEDGKLYLCVSSPTIKDKPVQIRPWNLSDSDFVMDGSQPLDPRKTIFVGGVPRPLRAVELAMIMDRLYGGVCYAGIDTDPELKYPKGAGRVAFSNQQSYIAAISARFVQLQHNDIDKRVEVKPYVLDDQMCDECQGARCGGKFAPFFCANVTCLQYYCEYCWASIHSRAGREFHKPLVKEGGDRPRHVSFRWS
ncbi:cytoplasmic polyadenylation element-binding protein 3-like [Salarias fasciatus]|uniref:cytoplasmic polyadenylation element-binding protein 3-like n=1 Tax=Salarias fasciatus TaxID=181472 RepID=UPI001176BDBD|nr:cytoplasmic polyadenylation element-binding protein 3-like [Salarias fasciatus]